MVAALVDVELDPAAEAALGALVFAPVVDHACHKGNIDLKLEYSEGM